MKIGFIGLGIMGAPMAGRLLDGGHQVFANDHQPIRPEILEKGATQVSSAREAAEKGDVIIIMVPDTPDVEIVLFGEKGAAAKLLST
jgi:2-hydroxy-3-oxopropionate reductase